MMSQEGQPYSKSREEMVQISERPPKEGGFQKKGNARDSLTSGPGVFSAGRFF